MSGGERPIGAAKGTQSDTEALCQPPPPSVPQDLTRGMEKWADMIQNKPVAKEVFAVDEGASKIYLTWSEAAGNLEPARPELDPRLVKHLEDTVMEFADYINATTHKLQVQGPRAQGQPRLMEGSNATEMALQWPAGQWQRAVYARDVRGQGRDAFCRQRPLEWPSPFLFLVGLRV